MKKIGLLAMVFVLVASVGFAQDDVTSTKAFSTNAYSWIFGEAVDSHFEYFTLGDYADVTIIHEDVVLQEDVVEVYLDDVLLFTNTPDEPALMQEMVRCLEPGEHTVEYRLVESEIDPSRHEGDIVIDYNSECGEIPEFGALAAGIAVVGAIGGFLVLRRRH